MKKIMTCVLTASMLTLTGLSDTEAISLFNRENSLNIFGAETTNLTNAANSLQSLLTSVGKDINSAIEKMRKLTIDVDTFDQQSSVIPVVFISERLANIAVSFGTMGSLTKKEIEGLKAIKNSKTGNAKEVNGRQLLRLSRKVMKVMEADLAAMRANIALIGKLCKGEGKISNANAIKTIFDKLLSTVKSTKKNLVDLFEKYEEESKKIADSAEDSEIAELFQDSQKYIEDEKEIANLYVELLEHIITYVKTGKSTDLEKFATECEEFLGSTAVTNKYMDLKRKVEDDEELDELRTKNKGNVSKKAQALGNDSTFRSEKGRTSQVKSQKIRDDEEDEEELSNARSSSLKRSASTSNIARQGSSNSSGSNSRSNSLRRSSSMRSITQQSSSSRGSANTRRRNNN